MQDYVGIDQNIRNKRLEQDEIDRNRMEQARIGGNKAKAISAELLELNVKNKLEETGKTR